MTLPSQLQIPVYKRTPSGGTKFHHHIQLPGHRKGNMIRGSSFNAVTSSSGDALSKDHKSLIKQVFPDAPHEGSVAWHQQQQTNQTNPR